MSRTAQAVKQKRARKDGPRLTILELLLALFLVSATAVVAVPIWQSDRLLVQEREAVAFLRILSRLQGEFAERNQGAYGWFEELGGLDFGRGLKTSPALLDRPWPDRGVLKRGGYHFIIYFFDDRGQAQRRPDLVREFKPKKDFFVIYAWPNAFGLSGRDLYAIDNTGRIYNADNTSEPYSGQSEIPPSTLLSGMIKDSPLPAPSSTRAALRWRVLPDGASR